MPDRSSSRLNKYPSPLFSVERNAECSFVSTLTANSQIKLSQRVASGTETRRAFHRSNWNQTWPERKVNRSKSCLNRTIRIKQIRIESNPLKHVRRVFVFFGPSSFWKKNRLASRAGEFFSPTCPRAIERPCLQFDRASPAGAMLHRETNVSASGATMQWELPEACRCTLAKALNRKNAKANRSRSIPIRISAERARKLRL